MTEDDVKVSVADELRLADEALRAAGALVDLGLPADAASRAYYAAFHAARALLYSIGVEERSHAALRTQLSRHFVKTGKLAAARSKDLAQLEALRVAGDYDSAFALGVDDVRPEVEKAARFIADIRALLGRS